MAGMGRAGMAAAIAAALGGPVAAQELSEKSVRTFMDYAWSMTPNKFTRPDGRAIQIDKNKRETVEIPLDVARDVIKAGRLTAHAQMCELPEDQVLNHRSLMKREEDKKKWSEAQMIYINQLHLVTVMLMAGKLQLVEREEGKEPKVVEESKAPVRTCTEEQRKKVKELITAYVKTGPPVQAVMPMFGPQAVQAAGAPAAAASAAKGPVPTSAPAGAPAAKKP